MAKQQGVSLKGGLTMQAMFCCRKAEKHANTGSKCLTTQRQRKSAA
jgi:hypothetical protein